MTPPGAVVVPEVVVGFVAGNTDGEVEHGGVGCGHKGAVWGKSQGPRHRDARVRSRWITRLRSVSGRSRCYFRSGPERCRTGLTEEAGMLRRALVAGGVPSPFMTWEGVSSTCRLVKLFVI